MPARPSQNVTTRLHSLVQVRTLSSTGSSVNGATWFQTVNCRPTPSVRAPERHRWKSESHAGGGLVEHKPVRASLRVPAAGGSLALSNVDETLTAMQSSQELPETSRSLPDAWETAVHHLQEALLERRHPTQHSTVERQQLKDALRWLVSTSQRASVPFCRYAVLFLKEFVREQVWEALLEPVLGCTHSTCAPWNDSRKRLTGTADWDTPTRPSGYESVYRGGCRTARTSTSSHGRRS